MFDQQRLHLEVWRVQQVVERGVVVDILVVDIDAMSNERGSSFFVSNNQRLVAGIAGPEDCPVECGPSQGIRRFYICPSLKQALRLRQVVKGRFASWSHGLRHRAPGSIWKHWKRPNERRPAPIHLLEPQHPERLPFASRL